MNRGEEHVMLLRSVPAEHRNYETAANGSNGNTNAVAAAAAADDRFTFLVTIKPSPPQKRRGLPAMSGDQVPPWDDSPPPSSSDKDFSHVLQELMEQLALPAEQEIDAQMAQRRYGGSTPRRATPPPAPLMAPTTTTTQQQGSNATRSRHHYHHHYQQSAAAAMAPTTASVQHHRVVGGSPKACYHPRKDTDELQEKIRRLQVDKDTLTLQVSVLGEQIEAQNEKIRDMEGANHQRKERAEQMEALLQKEMMLRTTLEAQKGSLVREVSELRNHVDSLDRTKLGLMDRLRRTENELASACRRLTDQESAANGVLGGRPVKSSPLSDPYLEMEKMKRALESVMAANDEKDRKIEELRLSMMRYKRIQDKMLCSPDSKSENELIDPTWWLPSSQQSADGTQVFEKPPLGPPRPQSASTPVHHGSSSGNLRSASPSPRQRMMSDPPSPIGGPLPDDAFAARPPKTPPPHSRFLVDHYGTVPRNYAPSECQHRPKAASFVPEDGVSSAATLPAASPEAARQSKNKGIKRLFSRLKRSNSQTMPGDLPPEEFRRGGFRATAGPRLGWSRELRAGKDILDVPFALWDVEKVVAWFHELGLSAYTGDCKRWVQSGDQLLKASTGDLEKELGIKNLLHRKKLALALQAIGSSDGKADELSALDYHWVTRWLDDVGLPQYKDAFSEARVDGRMLHYLSVEDLTHLRVTSLLHVTSLKQGIHVLRLHRFDSTCLKRRSSPTEAVPPTPADVALWTNHRVMEWLRSVDLSEYAPNLRGSGVHGALMILESRFTAELLATLLSIPPNKTLLRRHLTTHFKELVGAPIMQQKRQRESEPGYTPLTPSVKVKVSKKSQFSLMRKRSKSEMDLEELVCPMETWRQTEPVSPSSSPESSAAVPPAAQEVSPLQPRSAEGPEDRAGNWGCF